MGNKTGWIIAGVIVLEAIPVYGYMSAVFRGDPVEITMPMIMAFVGVVSLCVASTVVPLKIGLKRMEEFEF